MQSVADYKAEGPWRGPESASWQEAAWQECGDVVHPWQWGTGATSQPPTAWPQSSGKLPIWMEAEGK